MTAYVQDQSPIEPIWSFHVYMQTNYSSIENRFMSTCKTKPPIISNWNEIQKKGPNLEPTLHLKQFLFVNNFQKMKKYVWFTHKMI